MAHIEISSFVFDCDVCHTRCDGKSKGTYLFADDAAFSEQYEQLVINKINNSGRFNANKCDNVGYPDIVVYNLDGSLYSYIEIKVQRRTFMAIGNKLPRSGLMPSETLALNLSDLLRYFEIRETTHIPTSIIWVVLNRPCIVKEQQSFYYQTIDALKLIYEQCGDSRRFKRVSGEGDIVNGIHKGVTVNYHFSLKELKVWIPDKI